MRILYDGKIYTLQSAGGVSRYNTNLIQRLPDTITPILTHCQPFNGRQPTTPPRSVPLPCHPHLQVFTYRRFRPGRLSYWLEQYYFRWVEAQVKPDLVHPTYYSLLSRHTLASYRCPVVLTMHDLVHERFPEFDAGGYQAKENGRALRAADMVICVSEHTKQDVMEWYKIPAERIVVIYEASDLTIDQSWGNEPVPEVPYFLYVGSRASYKNFSGLLTAMIKVKSVHPQVCLAVVGLPWNDHEQRLLAQLNLTESVLHQGQVADRHLAKLYRCSLSLVYPSLYEGFGIPPLEAMACGTMVVASNTTSLPEVIDRAGLLVNPRSTNDLADALLMVIENPADRQRWIDLGRERVRCFSWEKSVQQTVAVYQRLVGSAHSV